MSRGEDKQLGPLSHSEVKKLRPSDELSILGNEQSKGGVGQAFASYPQDITKLYVPKPPKGHQKPVLMAHVGRIHPVNLDPDSQPLCYTEIEGLPFDDQGMILPHTILGSLEDFRNYLEAKEETELVRRIPKTHRDPPSVAPGMSDGGSHHCEAVERELGVSPGHRNIQSNALQHWHTRMRQRRRQQDLLSNLLDRPVKNLLMNQAHHFRETQEQREILNQVMPIIHSGYGYRVGSEFWSLPQRYGDEMSGITATLTQTEQGRREPVTHVGQPISIRQESGIISAETLHPASRTWYRGSYLQHQCQELREVLQDTNITKPDINRLEVIGSGKPFTFVTVYPSPSLEKEEEVEKKEKLDPQAQSDDVKSDALLIPALRFCGQLASWTGNSATNTGGIGISATIMFEALTGERASSHLELHNEGSTAIFYSWQQLPVPHSFPDLQSQTKNPHFYFNSSSGVILPGDTQQVEFIFKSEKPGIKTEVWQLNTHPLLLQGASMQVTLRGVALYQDKTKDQKLFIETKLEKIVMVKMCRSIVYEVLLGVHTPERPSSPAELYITEEQTFLNKNPKLQYLHQPVEDLKKLWQEVSPGRIWDLSVDSLRQVVLSLPKQESAQDTITRERGLAKLNQLFLQLSEPPEPKLHHITASAIGQQLWKKLLDTMAGEAMWLRSLLGLPENETWIAKKDEFVISDTVLVDQINKDEKSEDKGGTAAKEERSRARSRFEDDNKGESKSPTTEQSEESKKKGKRRDEVGKHIKEKQGKEYGSLNSSHPESTSQQTPEEQNVEMELMNIYRRLLHKKVYALMEDLVNTLCSLMDEGAEEDTHLLT